MFKISRTIAAAVSLLSGIASLAVPTAASAFPALQPNVVTSAPLQVEETAYFYEGRQYCFYPDGWRGPGYYLCGFPQRRGFFFAPGFGGFRGGPGFHGGGHFGGGHFGGGNFGGGHIGGGRPSGGGGHFGGGHGGGGHGGGGHGGGGHGGGHH